MMVKRVKSLSWIELVRRSDAGSALVETALTVPVIIALLLGAVELGDFAFRATEVSNAARAAAQYAAMNGGGFTDCNGTFAGGTCSSSSGLVAAAQQDAPRTNATCTSFTVTATSSCTCSGDGSTCANNGSTTYSCSSGKPVVTANITTSAQCSPIASVPGLFSGTFTLHGSAVQEVLQ
jgi:Flp pilus assembly protein TadG